MTMEVIIKYKSKKAISNPEYKHWLVQDKQLLGYLLNSMKEVLVQVDTLPSSICSHVDRLESMFLVHSHARATKVRMQLSNTRKGSLSTPAYFTKMKPFGDELVATGKPVQDEEIVSFIVLGHVFFIIILLTIVLGQLAKLARPG